MTVTQPLDDDTNDNEVDETQTQSHIPRTLSRKLLTVDEDTSWQELANCLGVDPDLFFPERGTSTREAKSVCRACNVREECLEFALRHVERFGIWGGMSERERRRVRRKRSIARAVEARTSVKSPVKAGAVDEDKVAPLTILNKEVTAANLETESLIFKDHGFTSFLLGCRCTVCELAHRQSLGDETAVIENTHCYGVVPKPQKAAQPEQGITKPVAWASRTRAEAIEFTRDDETSASDDSELPDNDVDPCILDVDDIFEIATPEYGAAWASDDETEESMTSALDTSSKFGSTEAPAFQPNPLQQKVLARLNEYQGSIRQRHGKPVFHHVADLVNTGVDNARKNCEALEFAGLITIQLIRCVAVTIDLTASGWELIRANEPVTPNPVVTWPTISRQSREIVGVIYATGDNQYGGLATFEALGRCIGLPRNDTWSLVQELVLIGAICKFDATYDDAMLRLSEPWLEHLRNIDIVDNPRVPSLPTPVPMIPTLPMLPYTVWQDEPTAKGTGSLTAKTDPTQPHEPATALNSKTEAIEQIPSSIPGSKLYLTMPTVSLALQVLSYIADQPNAEVTGEGIALRIHGIFPSKTLAYVRTSISELQLKGLLESDRDGVHITRLVVTAAGSTKLREVEKSHTVGRASQAPKKVPATTRTMILTRRQTPPLAVNAPHDALGFDLSILREQLELLAAHDGSRDQLIAELEVNLRSTSDELAVTQQLLSETQQKLAASQSRQEALKKLLND